MTDHLNEQLRVAAASDRYRVRLTDALRVAQNPTAIESEAARVLGHHLHATRVHYAELCADGVHLKVSAEYHDPNAASMLGCCRLEMYGAEAAKSLREGRTAIATDVKENELLTKAEKASLAERAIGAYVVVPLVKGNKPIAVLAIQHAQNRAWTPEEVTLIEDTAERTRAAMEWAHAEDALRASEERFRAYTTASSDVVYRMSPDWSEMRQLRGQDFIADTQEPTKSWLQKYIHPDDRARVLAAIDEAIRTRSTFALEHRVLRLDGTLGWTSSRAIPHIDGNGEITDWFGAASDITERKRVEAERDRFFELSADMMGIASLEGNWKRVNPAMTAILGWKSEELVETPFMDLVHPEDVESSKAAIAQLGGAQTLSRFEHRVRCKDGSYRWIAWNTSSFPAESVLYCVGRDMTERRTQEEMLRDADRRKDEFLSMLSHELRNPLAPIRNGIYILARAEAQSEAARRARTVIQRQTDHLTHLVDELLDVTRVKRGKIELRREALDIVALVRSTAEDLRSVFVSHSVTLATNFPREPVWVEADPMRIAQVTGNILHNASKFTPSGGKVVVTVRPLDTTVEVSVRDSGSGIDPLLLGHLFEPFAQGPRTLARTPGGLGLGLALVKGLIELHGGSVRATSEGVGRGSEFVFVLPSSPHAGKGTTPVESYEASRGRRVLVIDDNPDAADTLGMLIEQLGHTADVVYDGIGAIEKARATRYDVIFCDIGMPGMNGFEVAEKLRDGNTACPQIIAVSGYAQEADLMRAAAAGFDAHVPKPPDPDRIAKILAA